MVDKNDNEPQFYGVDSFEVREDVSVNTKVGQVNASDADEGSSGKVEYEIIAGGSA